MHKSNLLDFQTDCIFIKLNLIRPVEQSLSNKKLSGIVPFYI